MINTQEQIVNTQEHTVGLMSIEDLKGKRFYIPSYQRGYRWTTTEVEQLISDIKNFDPLKDGEFYCLQPLVVRQDSQGQWRVIDGQQRLTTIMLILKCCSEQDFFQMKYERGDYVAQLKDISSYPKWEDVVAQSSEYDTMELYYLYTNFQVVKHLLSDSSQATFKDKKDKLKLFRMTKFIWYDIDVAAATDDTDGKQREYQMFRNLNSGKITLTSAELVKALFLKKVGDASNEKEISQSLIAEEFDQIERRLREPDFWYFLTSEPERSSCISLLFDLIYQTHGCGNVKDTEKFRNFEKSGAYKTYNYFEYAMENMEDAGTIWEIVQKYFHILEGWFADTETYNLIGFLRASGGCELEDIFKIYNESINKSQFREYLKRKCLSVCNLQEPDDDYTDIMPLERLRESLSELRYDEERKRITDVLLMVNIATLNLQSAQTDLETQSDTYGDDKKRKDKQASKVKFSFASYHKCGWNVEHISPNNAIYTEPLGETQLAQEALPNGNFFRDILSNKREFPHLKDASSAIKSISEELWQKLDDYIAVDETSIMTLPNLTLLNEHDNKSIGNRPFCDKRNSIIKFQGQGSFVPPCTFMVFTKGYTEKVDKDKINFWSKEDRMEYMKRLCDILNEYFTNGQ